MKYKQKSQELIEISVDILNTLIHIEDYGCRMDTLMAFTNLIKIEESDLTIQNNKLDLIHSSAVVAKFVDLLQSSNITIVSRVISLIAHLTTSSHIQIDDFIVFKVLKIIVFDPQKFDIKVHHMVENETGLCHI